ncbi:TonB-dependent siderophore receptor [Aliarcobacter faecis]|uniref:TonB-dependent receptor domain-containing protein n=1 Tax=Aliarcobacter faecis TaxID=1564138 RepID=UPI00047C914A|nr:TonB-dependent receptor [Aliarcobacter faecis]QKF74037.1 TonB-dependent siderophore receptor [Aliarcobacter faecis]
MKTNNIKLIKLSLILAPSLIFAQTITLDEISVKEKKETNTNTVNIDLQKVEQHQENSLTEMLKNNSSIEIGGGAKNAQRIYLRGIESSNLNISLDGAKQGKNMFQHRGNELGVSPELLKVVDIKTSTDASKSGALGGSINMTTKDAQDFVKNGKNHGTVFKAGYNTNAEQKLGNATAYSVFNENLGAYVSIGGVNSENYENGAGDKVLATGYKDRDYLFKLSLLDTKNNDLRATISQNENNGIYQWGQAGSDVGLNTDPSKLEKIVMTTTNYALNHNYNPNDLLNLETNLNFSEVKIDRKTQNKDYKNDTFGLKVQNHFDFDVSSWENKISLGVDYSKEYGKGSFDPHNLDKAITKYSDVNSKNQAIFLQGRTKISDLGIDYGLRFDDYSFETGFGKATGDTFSPNIGLDYAITDNSLIYANYGQASRMGGIIPFTWMTNIKKDTQYSSKLDPEKSKRYEAGYKYEKRDTLLNDDYLSFNANVFKTKIKDVIIAKATNGGSGEGGRTLVDIFNASNEFESKGYELKLSYAYDIFQTALGFTKVKTNTINDDSGIVPGVDESITLRRIGAYDSDKFVWNVGIEPMKNLVFDYTLNAVGGIDNPVVRGGYTTHDVNMKYDINSDWTIFLAVNNLTNKDYGKHTTLDRNGEYRHEMGRDYRFALKYEF